MSAALPLDLKFQTVSTLEVHDYENAVLHAALAESLANGAAGYPVFRHQQVAARIDPRLLLERLALQGGWQVQRPDPVTLVARTAGALIMVFATGKPQHCTMSFRLWAQTPAIADTLQAKLLAETAPCRISESLFHLDWRFLTSHGLKRAITVERPQETLLDEAYPTLPEGVGCFIDRYLGALESVLLLQGPPGSGKTRLIREILRQMSARKIEDDEQAVALYSGDKGVWDTDEIFVEFITGDHDAFLIEDADQLLAPRADGNQTLHRFLNISDGIAQAQGRKIIFSTNLPNVRDIDAALVRPGRCFAHVFFHELEVDQARRLLERLCDNEPDRVAAGLRQLTHHGSKTHSVAQIYAAHRAAGRISGQVNVKALRAANE
jgi:hypothetical protein